MKVKTCFRERVFVFKILKHFFKFGLKERIFLIVEVAQSVLKIASCSIQGESRVKVQRLSAASCMALRSNLDSSLFALLLYSKTFLNFNDFIKHWFNNFQLGKNPAKIFTTTYCNWILNHWMKNYKSPQEFY